MCVCAYKIGQAGSVSATGAQITDKSYTNPKCPCFYGIHIYRYTHTHFATCSYPNWNHSLVAISLYLTQFRCRLCHRVAHARLTDFLFAFWVSISLPLLSPVLAHIIQIWFLISIWCDRNRGVQKLSIQMGASYSMLHAPFPVWIVRKPFGDCGKNLISRCTKCGSMNDNKSRLLVKPSHLYTNTPIQTHLSTAVLSLCLMRTSSNVCRIRNISFKVDQYQSHGMEC